MLLTLARFTPADLVAARSLTLAALHSTAYLSPGEIDALLEHCCANYAQCMAEGDAHLFLKCLQGDEMVGLMLVKAYWNLAELYIHPTSQGSGAGRALLAQALLQCRARSPRGHLRANASRNAEGFYRRRGFVDFPLAQPLPYGCVPLVYPFD